MNNLYRKIALVLALVFAFCALMITPQLTEVEAAGTYNSGTRHVAATSLSSQAAAYYKGDYTFSSLSGQTPDTIKSKLYTLMSTTMTDSVSYTSLTSYWPYTDASGGKTGTILFYSDTVSSSFNREHVWPKSRAGFYQKNGGSDLHHLRPTNTAVNSTRGNMTMGNVRGVLSSYSTYSYGGNTVLYYNSAADLVEVNDNVKGDVARILLYVYVRWQQPNLYQNVASADLPPMDSDDDANNGYKVIESLDTLLEWVELDPVDTWEMSRNDLIEGIQGNRNVFIDYPEYAWLIFGLDVPDDYQTPSGNGGTVGNSPTPTPEGYTPTPTPLITATPTATPTSTPIVAQQGDYVLVTDINQITEGDYIIYGVNGNYDGAMNNICTSSRMGAEDVTITNNTIKNPSSSIVWHFSSVQDLGGSKGFSIYNAEAEKYLTIYRADSSGYLLSDTADTFTATEDS